MRDIALYKHWLKNMASGISQSIAMEEWLRSGILRISVDPSALERNIGHPPFYPFVGYANDADDVISLMESLRQLSSWRSDIEAGMLRSAVARVICTWHFDDSNALLAIRLSFRIGSVFGCVEVCDELAKRVPLLLASPAGVITGLSDMACGMGNLGQSLISLLVAQSVESRRLNYLPYLLTRLIESSVRADVWQQRELVLRLIAQYRESLISCGEAIDAIEALTDVVIASLRLLEAPLTEQHSEQVCA